jgi:hypothetical protein
MRRVAVNSIKTSGPTHEIDPPFPTQSPQAARSDDDDDDGGAGANNMAALIGLS